MSLIPVFDIESVGWSYPISVGFWDGYNYHEFLRKDETDDVIQRFLDFLQQYEGLHIYAHCAGKYDNLFILDNLCKRDEPITIQAGVSKLHWVTPNITFEDSYLLAPMKLSKLSNMLNIQEKMVWDHNQEEKPWEMSDNKRELFRAYQKSDCLILSDAMSKLCEEIVNNFGVTPSMTMSTTAAKAFDKFYFDLRQVESNEHVDTFIRDATYGARNEIYKRYGESIHHYDIHDMYVSCYDTPVPIGELRWAKTSVSDGVLGEVTVKVPKDCYIGPLPLRRQNRLIYPRGEWTGWYDLREVRHAAEKYGVDFTIRRQLIADEQPILKEFGIAVSRLRGSTPLSRYWKLFGISVSGKFGQSRWRDSVKHITEIKNFRGAVPIDPNETYFRLIEYQKGKAPYIKPAITMRIRAEARIRHLDMLDTAHKNNDLYYCDTDSIFCHHEFEKKESPPSGELAYLGEYERGYFIRQKLYGLITQGKLIQKSAGYSDLKLTEKDFQRLLKEERIEFDNGELPNFRQILNQKELEWIKSKRYIATSFLPNREVIGNDSQPILIEE